MLAGGNHPREEQAAETHAAHERPEQYTQRDGGRSNHELKKLEPDDLVNQRGAAAAEKQQQEHRKHAARRHSVTPLTRKRDRGSYHAGRGRGRGSGSGSGGVRRGIDRSVHVTASTG